MPLLALAQASEVTHRHRLGTRLPPSRPRLSPDATLLRALRRLFPCHHEAIRSVGLWRYFLFRGEREATLT
jgi:hypothetical protein